MLLRHDLPAEQHPPHRLRHPVVQPVEGGDQAQGRHGPGEAGHLSVTQPVQQFLGPGEELLGHHRELCPGFQHGVQVLHRHVKVKGGLVGQDVRVVHAETVHEGVDEVDHRPVAHHHPFGLAGGARGEVGVQRVGVHHLRTHRLQPGRLEGRCQQLLHIQNSLGGENLQGPDPVGPVGNNVVCLEHRLNLPQPGRGQVRVQGDIEPSSIHRPPKGPKGLTAFLQKDRHGLPQGDAFRQGRAHLTAAHLQFLKGGRAPGVLHSDSVGANRGAVFQIFQYRFHRDSFLSSPTEMPESSLVGWDGTRIREETLPQLQPSLKFLKKCHIFLGNEANPLPALRSPYRKRPRTR